MATLTFGILTVSDTCSQNRESDKSGPALLDILAHASAGGRLMKVKCMDIVPDVQWTIEKILIKWSDEIRVNVILTTGGTGFSSRDVTPEATKNVIEREAPGMAIAMMNESLKITPMAMLSRAVCGIRDETLIINLPGSPKAATECLNVVLNAIPHAVDLLIGASSSVKATHDRLQQSRPPSCPHHSPDTSWDLDNVASRPRESLYPMISLHDALNILKKTSSPYGVFNLVDIWQCHGRILALDVRSPCNLPPFRASVKDGYAVVASDGKGKRKVIGGLEAGALPGSVKIVPGYCARINTGAALPEGATAVVQVEDTLLLESSPDGKEERLIEILSEPKDGQDIRPIGCDVKEGDLVLRKGSRIGAVEAGILASCGIKDVLLQELPRIGILSTGNELQNAGEPAKPGHVYDSNKISLMLLLKENGYPAKDLGIAADRKSDMIDKLSEAIERVDVVVTTGSVSMGDRDMLKPLLKDVFKATIHFGRVNLKPGKPTTYATCDVNGDRTYFVCLPGNPVSAVVTANLFLIPLLNRLAGNAEKPVVVAAEVTETYQLDSRPEFARVVLQWSSEDLTKPPKAYSTGNQMSSRLLSCKKANALLMLPERTAERSRVSSGELVSAMLLGFNQQQS